MPTIAAAGIDLHYTRQGDGDPVVLIAGLSGQGRGWGEQIDRFAAGYDTIVPDHPGTGESTMPDTYTLEHHAAAMADLVSGLEVGPAHIVGSSTGGAIAQIMALDHPDTVRTISLVSSWARADDFFRHQFAVRKDIALRLGGAAYAEDTALFLFSPTYFRDHYDKVREWCETASQGDPERGAARIDMILAHDQLGRLGGIACPTLVLVGAADGCTPPHFSEELAAAIPGAEHVVIDGGHLIYKESPAEFHRVVTEFLARH